MREKIKIAIVWGGAAGMMCAAQLLESADQHGVLNHLSIRIFEKNPVLGKKVSITGGGRCNVTTGIIDKKTLLSKYVRGAEFIKKSLGVFGPKKMREWCEVHGVPLKQELDGRIFPVSDDSSDIIAIFTRIFSRYPEHIRIDCGSIVEGIRREKEGGRYVIRIRSGDASAEHIADICCLATGGAAYSHTGSDGAGYEFARSLGHSITTLGPSLTSFETAEEFPKRLSGIAFESSSIKFFSETDGKEKSITGPFIFTHFWISGPAVFALSAHLAHMPLSENSPLHLHVAPISGFDVQKWDSLLQEACVKHPVREVRNIIPYLPERFIDALWDVLPWIETILRKKSSVLSKEERKTLAKLLWDGVPLTLVSRRAGEEFVTAGGIDTNEVDPETMESRISHNLYLAGEMLNIDGVTGGFNLQAAWSTGYSIAEAIILRTLHSVSEDIEHFKDEP